nr:PREDICTED: uronyl 2-sulfotransferase-like [Latimeria chalumnae]|eukprot:XP_014339261.1 PREDICTED: uronyl 2-sulfotransferase-like [Latimeria chalumnae]
MTVTVKKQTPSPEAIQVLYQRMKYEYDFYYFVREKFHMLKRNFGLKTQVKAPQRPEYLIPTRVETEEPMEDNGDDDDKDLDELYKRPYPLG